MATAADIQTRQLLDASASSIDEATRLRHQHSNLLTLEKYGEAGDRATFAGTDIAEAAEDAAAAAQATADNAMLGLDKKLDNPVNLNTVPALKTYGLSMNVDRTTTLTEVAGGGEAINHAELQNLDYEHSGHTGFAPDSIIKKLIATFLNSENFIIADYGLKIGDKIDAYLVGGGGGGNPGGGAGGGGYCKLIRNYVLQQESYSITIGAGGYSATDGGDTIAFGITVLGGKSSSGQNGGNGGSGGGALSGGRGGDFGSDGGAPVTTQGFTGGIGGGNIDYDPVNPYDGIAYGCGGGGGFVSGTGNAGTGGGAGGSKGTDASTGRNGSRGGGGGGGLKGGNGGLGGGGGGGGNPGGAGGSGLVYIYA